jgi:threonine/homoserine/homoserine lactone efflux protein
VTSPPLAAVSVAWLASALAFAVATAGTPGPNNAMLTSSGSLWGFRRTVPHMLGVSIGFPIMLIAVAAGGGDLLTHHPAAVTVMRWLGASYLLYLAWKIGSARPAAGGAGPEHGVGDPEHGTPGRSRPLSFAQAALFQWVNVKAWLITVSALATLTSVAHHPSFGRAVILAGVFLAVTLPITAFWTTVGVGVSRVARAPRALRRFNLAMAALLVASVVSVVAGIG